MPRGRIQIVMTTCKRCGKEIAKTDRSIHGMDKLKDKYGDICSACTSEEENFQMLRAQGQGIITRFGSHL